MGQGTGWQEFIASVLLGVSGKKPTLVRLLTMCQVLPREFYTHYLIQLSRPYGVVRLSSPRTTGRP